VTFPGALDGVDAKALFEHSVRLTPRSSAVNSRASPRSLFRFTAPGAVYFPLKRISRDFDLYFYGPTPRTTKTGPFGAGPCTLAGTFGGVIV